MNDDYDFDNLGERPTPIVWEPRRSAGAALWIAAGIIAGVVLFSVYVAPRVAWWLVERGVG